MVYVTHDQVEAMGMADRIAVMNLGVLQQIGTPLEIYNQPANVFVAGFVGSTRINFLPAEAIPVPAPAGANGHGLTLAVRPEAITLVAPDAPEATVSARVNLVEPLGARDVVHLTCADEDVRALATPGRRPRVGENVGLALDPTRILFFDSASGSAVR
jgi:ABC-type sugar transport system ATPase subunit